MHTIIQVREVGYLVLDHVETRYQARLSIDSNLPAGGWTKLHPFREAAVAAAMAWADVRGVPNPKDLQVVDL